MSNCPLFVPRKEKEGVEKANCGNCKHWDWKRQRCREEEKLKKMT